MKTALTTLASLTLILAFTFAPSAKADSSHKHKKTTTTTTVESSDDSDSDDSTTTLDTPPPMPGASTDSEPTRDFVITHVFGSKDGSGTAGCKVESASKEAVKDLKAECKEWIKEQKGDLKGKYMSSVCEEDCADCGMSLKRCAVNGTIHYRSKTVKD